MKLKFNKFSFFADNAFCRNFRILKFRDVLYSCPSLSGLCVILLIQFGWGKDWYDLTGSQVNKMSVDTTVRMAKPVFKITGINKSGSVAEKKNDVIRYTIQIDISGFAKDVITVESEDYSVVRVPDCSWQTSDIGKPEVPIKIVMVPLPSGKRPVTQVHVLREMNLMLGQIHPAQPKLPDIQNPGKKAPFAKDAAFYASKGVYPESNILSSRIVKMRDHRFLRLEISPMQVWPAAAKVTVATQLNIGIMLENDPASAGGDDDSLSDPNGFDRFLLDQ